MSEKPAPQTPASIDPDYKKPMCRRSYDHSDFKDAEDFDECDALIEKPDKKCCAPRWCHPSLKPSCTFSRQELLGDKPQYLTTNNLCISCLEDFKVCCPASAHPSTNSSQPESEEVTLNFTTEGNQSIQLCYSENFVIFLKDRYGPDFPHGNVFIRQCYREIYPLLNKNYIITGVPGIGKSVFLHYILYNHLLNEVTKRKSFALSLTYGQYTLFEYLREACPGQGTVYRMTKNRYNTDCEGALFCVNDYKEELENTQINKTMNWFLSSPNPARFKLSQWRYKSIYMPVWSLDELNNAFTLNPLKRRLFELLGGVPRNIIQSEEDYEFYETLLEQVLTSNGKDLMANFSGCSIEQLADVKMSYKLVFINPTWDDSRQAISYTSRSFSFASPLIESKLYQKHRMSFINTYLEIFRQGVVDFKKLDNISKIFEKAFLYLAPPAQNKQYQLTSIMEHSEIKFKYFSYSSEIIFFNSDFTNFQANIFYAPMNENYESVDAFCLRSELFGTTSRTQSNNVLYLFQVTTSKRHPVKLNGLKVVRNHYTTKGYPIHQYRLVFVLPKGSHIKEQNIESEPHPPTNSQPNSATAAATATDTVTDTAFISQITQYRWIFDFSPEDLKLLKNNTPIYLNNPSQLLGKNKKLVKRKRSSSIFEKCVKKILNINL